MKNKTLKRTWILVKPYTKTIIIVTLLSLIISICEIIKPYLIKVIIDDYLSNNVWEKAGLSIAAIGTIYLAIVIVGNIIDFVASTTTNMMGEDAVFNLRNKMFYYTEHANIPFHDKTSAGKIFVRITNDAEDITTLFKEVITGTLKDIILIIVILAIMFVLAPKLALVTVLVFPFVILSSVLITKKLNKIYAISKKIRSRLTSFLAESIYGLKLIKIFNRQKEKRKQCEDLNEEFVNSRKMTGILEGLLPGFMKIFEYLAVSIVTCTVTYHFWNIRLDVGIVYVFFTYIRQIFAPINRIIENMETVQEAVVSINRIFDLIEDKSYIEDFDSGKKIEKIDGKIEFKNVWFAYNDEDWVLKNISFTIEKGQSIALVGKTGSRQNYYYKSYKSFL